MGKIRELPKPSARLLTSSQNITSVYCVVKELIENALDSSSKNVEVKLEEYGLEKIEVKDNGCGIHKNDLEFVAKPHFTSKIASYSDIYKVETYGFRGEALGAICAVADLIITTKSSEENVGSAVNFAHDGQIISSKLCSCAQGTTVSVLNLFKNIPVRRQYYRSEKNKKDDLHKVEDLLIAYGCIRNDVRFALHHNKNLIWQKPALCNTKNSLIHILGNAVVDHLEYAEHIDEQAQRKIEAYLPKLEAPLTCSFTTASRCITAINKRPVRIKAVDKLLKEYYNSVIQNSGKARYPICYVSFTTLLTEVDVNVEPNKTTVMLRNSEEILEQFSKLLKNFYFTDINDNNVSEIPADTCIQQPKSNASEFVDSLKATCETKLQQCKLTILRENFTPLESHPLKKNSMNSGKIHSLSQSDNSLVKNDIVCASSLKEPCKKKLKTSTQSSQKDIDNHINTLKDFFAVKEQTDGNKMSSISFDIMDSVPSVTVQRNHSGTGMERSAISDEALKNTNCGKITAFEISSNMFSNSNLLDCATNQKQHLTDTSMSLEMVNEDLVKKSVQSNNDCANNQKEYLSNSSMSIESLKDDSVKKPSIDVNGLNEEAWSCGVNSLGESIQPVAVLQPKSITTLKCNLKRNADGISNKELPVTTSDNICKRPEKNKESPERRNALSERKLTAFDMYCNNHRLEIAAENPEFNTQKIAQLLFEKWNKLSDEEKVTYKNMVYKNYKQDIKKKERLGKTISQNLSQDVRRKESPKIVEIELKTKMKSKNVSCCIKQIKNFYLRNKREKSSCRDLNIVNYVAPGIWVCSQNEKLYLLNTFRLQETIIYHRLLETYQFDAEPLESPKLLSISVLGEDAMSVLMQLNNSGFNKNGKIQEERLIANGFDIKILKGENNEISVELTGVTNCIAFYGIPDLKELLLTIKEKGIDSRLSLCRPGKIVFYLQSEANRMSRQSPACLRKQDVEDLLNQRNKLPVNCNMCIHQKTFFNEIWKL